MSFLNKMFGKKEKDNSPKIEGGESEEKKLPWIPANENRWGIELLDLRPISQTMLSTSKDPRMAENAVSYGAENGTTFWNKMPEEKFEKIKTNITFPIDGKLYPGVLFNPSVMENKWAIYFDGHLLYFVRSWFREVFVVAETRQENNQLIIESIRGHFVGDTDDEDITTEAILTFLLISHALNEIVPAPLPIYLKEDTYNAGLWSFSIFGNMAHVGVFDNKFCPQPAKPLRSHSLLHIAVAQADLEKIEQYVNEGIDINALAGDGLSPLHWAISTESLMKLLELGANLNVRSAQGATPIMNAVQSGNVEHLKILVSAGADINAQDNRGFTTLHRAAEMGHTDIVRFLLANGADSSIDAEGYTALSLAEKLDRKEIIELLKN